MRGLMGRHSHAWLDGPPLSCLRRPSTTTYVTCSGRAATRSGGGAPTRGMAMASTASTAPSAMCAHRLRLAHPPSCPLPLILSLLPSPFLPSPFCALRAYAHAAPDAPTLRRSIFVPRAMTSGRRARVTCIAASVALSSRRRSRPSGAGATTDRRQRLRLSRRAIGAGRGVEACLCCSCNIFCVRPRLGAFPAR